MRSVRRSCSLKIPIKISVLCNEADVCSSISCDWKRFEHNLATEEDCVLHCGSLMPAAAALIHPSDHVPCVLGPCTTCQSAGCQQPLPLQVG